MTIGEIIKTRRIDLNMTQKELAELCGIAPPTIRKYELGTLNPKIETRQRIASALRLPVSELLDIPVDKRVQVDKFKQLYNKLEAQVRMLKDTDASIEEIEDAERTCRLCQEAQLEAVFGEKRSTVPLNYGLNQNEENKVTEESKEKDGAAERQEILLQKFGRLNKSGQELVLAQIDIMCQNSKYQRRRASKK